MAAENENTDLELFLSSEESEEGSCTKTGRTVKAWGTQATVYCGTKLTACKARLLSTVLARSLALVLPGVWQLVFGSIFLLLASVCGMFLPWFSGQISELVKTEHVSIKQLLSFLGDNPLFLLTLLLLGFFACIARFFYCWAARSVATANLGRMLSAGLQEEEGDDQLTWLVTGYCFGIVRNICTGILSLFSILRISEWRLAVPGAILLIMILISMSESRLQLTRSQNLTHFSPVWIGVMYGVFASVSTIFIVGVGVTGGHLYEKPDTFYAFIIYSYKVWFSVNSTFALTITLRRGLARFLDQEPTGENQEILPGGG